MQYYAQLNQITQVKFLSFSIPSQKSTFYKKLYMWQKLNLSVLRERKGFLGLLKLKKRLQ